jgi:hypothetical protein
MPTITTVAAGGDGGTLTLAGSGFGSKATPGPLVFEKFDGGRLTSTLTNNATGGEMTYSSEVVRPRRTHAAKADYSKNSGSDGQWCSWQYNQGTAPRWYVSWRVYLPATWHWGEDAYGGSDDGLANIKIIRFFPTGSNYTNIDAVLHAYDNYNWKRAYEHESGNDEAYINGVPWFNETFSLEAWHHFRTEFGENSGLDARDGVFKIWVDQTKILEDTAVQTNVSGDSSGYQLKRPYVIGMWDSWGYSGGSMPAYFADIVVDESWARVELGDAPTWEACTNLEYQPATAWSDGAITCTVNLGAFSDGQPLWAFVTDEHGRRSAGQALEGGEAIIPPDGGGEVLPPEPGPEPPFTGSHAVTTELVVSDQPALLPDFSIALSPQVQTVTGGETAVYTVTVASVGGFADSVNFSVSGASSNSSETFDPAMVVGQGTARLSIATNQHGGETPVGTNTITVTGSSAGLQHTASASFNVGTASAAGFCVEAADFALSVEPSQQTITPGATTTYTVTVTPSGGFAGLVTFSVSGASSKTSESFEPPSVTGSGTSTLTIVSTAETPLGTNTVTVTGTSS